MIFLKVKFNLMKIHVISNDLVSMQIWRCGPKLSEVTNETPLKKHGEVIFHKSHPENKFKSKKYSTISKPRDKMAVCVTLALSNTKKP